MDDRQQSRAPANNLLQRLHDRAPTSSQVIGFLTFLVSGGILLVLAGFTLTAAILALLFFAPLILLTSPVWVPAAALFFVTSAGVLSACGFCVAVVAAAAWIYRYYSGGHPVGSDRVDYARGRIADTATHVKDYAREYGGYLHGRVKDAAPGA